MNPLRLFAVPFCCACVSIASAGQLDAFERDANKAESKKEPEHRRRDQDEADPFDDLWGDLLLLPFWYGGSESLARMNPDLVDFDATIPLRAPGEPLIPILRADVDWQHIEDNLSAWNFGGELGYGPLALRATRQQFTEELADGNEDRLDLTMLLGLYRMSFAACVEIDLGGGMSWLDGDQESSAGAIAAGITIHPFEHYGFEFRPVWADRIAVYDAGLVAGVDFIAAKAGWRWTESPDESLNGPYAGLSLRY